MGRRGVSPTTSAENWKNGRDAMKALILFIGWCLLFVLCWPVALLTLVLFPFVWLISLPLRLIGITLEAVFALLRAILLLPARLLAWRRKPDVVPAIG